MVAARLRNVVKTEGNAEAVVLVVKYIGGWSNVPRRTRDRTTVVDLGGREVV